MNVNTTESATLRIEAFLAESRSAFNFLATDAGFLWETSVQHATAHGFEIVDPRAVTGWFWVVASFRTDRIRGEVTYGDRESCINCRVAPASFGADTDPYALWEWADACQAPAYRVAEADWALTTQRVSQIVQRVAHGLAGLQVCIAKADEAVRRRLDRARAARRDELAERRDDLNRQHAVKGAAMAFRQGDYARVVELLRPHQTRLSPAQLKKLEFARRRART